jgi:hypothetical protein
MNDNRQQEIKRLNETIQKTDFNKVVEAELKTSERVLKRITDGIYRQPSSALRELVVNSYDADATLVEIQTDPPRFKRVIVRDNGNGLSIEALSYLVNSIGGSAKRTTAGKDIGICNKKDRTLSPGGRKLIGKIGIGLFSVAQLTKEFQIITKTENTDYRIIADVVLHTYSEDVADPDKEFKAGTVRIWKVPATDIDSHGTEVILRNLLKQTWEDLTSKEMWLRCDPQKMAELEDIVSVVAEPPAYHIGCVHEDMPDEIEKDANLPWKLSDTPKDRFQKLVDGMDDLRGKRKNPSIEENLDYYLRTLWILGLSLPLDYVDGHPFDIGHEKGLRIFTVGNGSKDQAQELDISDGNTIRSKLKLISPERGSARKFRIIIDGIELFRPVKFRNLPKTLESVPYSLLFVGKAKPDMSVYPKEVRGGDDLEFEAYLFWNHVIVPKEHAGVMIRINDANGVLYDSSFMQYPISEITRKNQLTAEIFVTKGLDAALNIDRESFNYSHPHYQYLTHWVHNAFRQFSNKHKAIAKGIRDASNKEQSQKELDDLQKQIEESIRTIHPDEDIPLPQIQFTDDEAEQATQRKKGILSFQRKAVFEVPLHQRGGKQARHPEDAKFEEKIKAVAKVLDAYGVFDNMPYEKQQRLLQAIVKIFSHS